MCKTDLASTFNSFEKIGKFHGKYHNILDLKHQEIPCTFYFPPKCPVFSLTVILSWPFSLFSLSSGDPESRVFFVESLMLF